MNRLHSRGFTLVELMAFIFVISLVTLGVVSTTLSAARSADRQSTEATIVASERTAMDEILRESRAARNIEVSRTIGGISYSTDATSTIVLCTPGFDGTGVLDGALDYIAFRYNAGNRRLTKSVAPGAGSQRAALNNFVVAADVQSVAYTYRVREQFDYKGVNQFVLQANAATAPQAYVNGTPVACSYVASTRTVTVPTATSGSDVQILYTVNPSVATLRYVTGIDLTLTLSSQDGRRVTRTMTLTGSARLRNRRV